MSTIRVGSTKEYADNWDKIFGGKKTAVKRAAAKKASPKKKAKKAPKKR